MSSTSIIPLTLLSWLVLYSIVAPFLLSFLGHLTHVTISVCQFSAPTHLYHQNAKHEFLIIFEAPPSIKSETLLRPGVLDRRYFVCFSRRDQGNMRARLDSTLSSSHGRTYSRIHPRKHLDTSVGHERRASHQSLTRSSDPTNPIIHSPWLSTDHYQHPSNHASSGTSQVEWGFHVYLDLPLGIKLRAGEIIPLPEPSLLPLMGWYW